MLKKVAYSVTLAQMQKILAEYKEPLNVRQLFYQFVQRGLMENCDAGYQKISRDSTKARENFEISPDQIEDRGRMASEGDIDVDMTSEQFIHQQLGWLANKHQTYRYPKWLGQPKYIEVWSEKQALERPIREIAAQFGVVSCIAKGFSSFTYVYNAAQRIIEQQEDGKNCEILYFGDFDPSGEDMVRDLRNRLEKYGVEDPVVKKCALTSDQVTQYHLPVCNIKSSDSRSANFAKVYGNHCVEMDALSPPLLRSIITQSILASLDQKIWDQNIATHEAERDKIKLWCDSVTKTLAVQP